MSRLTTRQGRIYVLANVDVPHHGVVERSVVGASRATRWHDGDVELLASINVTSTMEKTHC